MEAQTKKSTKTFSLSQKKKKKKNQVRLIDPKTGKLQKDEQILSQASATVVAGMDTTAHALSFALLCIATTPGVQGRVAAELAALGLLVGSSSSDSHPSASAAPPPRPRALEYADLSRIPYLTAVIKESMRLWPVGGAGVGRVADRDVDIGGFLVKKGTEVAVPMFCLHRERKRKEEKEGAKKKRRRRRRRRRHQTRRRPSLCRRPRPRKLILLPLPLLPPALLLRSPSASTRPPISPSPRGPGTAWDAGSA